MCLNHHARIPTGLQLHSRLCQESSSRVLRLQTDLCLQCSRVGRLVLPPPSSDRCEKIVDFLQFSIFCCCEDETDNFGALYISELNIFNHAEIYCIVLGSVGLQALLFSFLNVTDRGGKPHPGTGSREDVRLWPPPCAAPRLFPVSDGNSGQVRQTQSLELSDQKFWPSLYCSISGPWDCFTCLELQLFKKYFNVLSLIVMIEEDRFKTWTNCNYVDLTLDFWTCVV